MLLKSEACKLYLHRMKSPTEACVHGVDICVLQRGCHGSVPRFLENLGLQNRAALKKPITSAD